MEHTKIEVALVKQIEDQAAKQEFCELNELQLALVGGGAGDILWG